MANAPSNQSSVVSIASRFAFGAAVAAIHPYGRGLINDTYLVTLASNPSHRVILQRINTRVFTHPEWIMDNLRLISDHAARHRNATPLVFPAIFSAADGVPHVRDADGGFWRAQQFIPNGRTVHALESLAQARELGAALGAFHVLVGEVPCAQLHTTLPGFHVTPGYLARYDDAVARGTDHPGLRDEMEFVEQRRGFAATLEDAKRRGVLAARPTHGDPKIDNFLFDVDNHAISVIDLDTVQPGLIHYDIGDLVRSACNRAGEATPGASVEFDLPACESILTGYVLAARALLNSGDYDHLYDAIRLIPFELGLRFLTDHIEGDVYFKTTHRGQNVERARAQFELTRRIEAVESDIRRVIDALRAGG